jgi:hypothetical protein
MYIIGVMDHKKTQNKINGNLNVEQTQLCIFVHNFFI